MNTTAAIDIGYRNTKCMFRTVQNQPARTLLFPSLALPAAGSPPGRLLDRRNTRLVEVDDIQYEVGPDADLLSGVHTALVLHENYINTPEHQALFLGALSYMGMSEIDVLAVGLPVEFMAHQSDDLKKRLAGVHTVPGLGQVRVKHVVVLPQPVGGLIDHLTRLGVSEAEAPRTTLMIDPGFFTVDWTASRGLKYLPAMTGSFPAGVSQVLQSMARNLSDELGVRYDNLHSLDRAMVSGELRVAGQAIDIHNHLDHARERLVPAIHALCNQVGAGLDIDRIVVGGGGANIIAPLIKHAFPKHQIEQMPTPVMANVRGFFLMAENCQAAFKNEEAA